MGQDGWPSLIAWMAVTIATSALLTALAIGYARRRNMIDQPGQRRLHRIPTPRGGGIAIIATLLPCLVVPLWMGLPAATTAIPLASGRGLLACGTVAVAIVAAVGWIDDHRGLSASWRLLAHYLAAGVLILPVLLAAPGLLHSDMGALTGLDWLIGGIIVLFVATALVWSINLHNFMDGANGLLASQAIFVFVVLALVRPGVMTGGATADLWTTVNLLLAAAVLGFLPFNFPRARIFMGDVGSGSLGLLIGMVALQAVLDPALDFAIALIACSAFAADATATLLSRMLRGRRWYSAHREHLYHWLVRSGYTHPQVVGFYMGWNLIVAVPAIALVQSGRRPPSGGDVSLDLSAPGLGVLVLVHALAVLSWLAGKRYCLARVRAGGTHGIA